MRVLQDEDSSTDAAEVFGNQKNDHRILNATLKLIEETDKTVVLVSKDINLRVKVHSLRRKICTDP